MARTNTLEVWLLRCFVVVDSGFILYWLVTALHLLPPEYLYRDYADPILVAWNWSFLPLDLLVSLTGFAALGLRRQGDPRWRSCRSR